MQNRFVSAALITAAVLASSSQVKAQAFDGQFLHPHFVQYYYGDEGRMERRYEKDRYNERRRMIRRAMKDRYNDRRYCYYHDC